MTLVDNRKDIDACRLREIEDPVRSLDQLPDILIVCLGCPHSELWKLGQSVNSAKDSLNHALGIVRRRAATCGQCGSRCRQGVQWPTRTNEPADSRRAAHQLAETRSDLIMRNRATRRHVRQTRIDRLPHVQLVQLPMVEVDATYYAMPSEATSQRWVERTPPHFMFNIKAHSLMTGHPTDPARLPQWLRDDLPLRLRSAHNVYAHHFSRSALDEVWRRFLSALAPLRAAGKLGAIMLQFPKWFTPSRESAAALALARDRLGDWPASVEVRHREWVSDRIAPRLFALLRDLRLSYVCVDAPQGWESSVPPVMSVTNPELAIIRFHGRRADTWESRHQDVTERFRYLYSGAQLSGWLDTLSRTIDEARRVHLTFNNNKWNYATTNAVEMNAIITTAPSQLTRSPGAGAASIHAGAVRILR